MGTSGVKTSAGPRSRGPKLTRGGRRWALVAIVCQHLNVARVAEFLGVAWNAAKDDVLAEGHRVLTADPSRFDGVRVIGVDEQVWRHTRRGDKYVTVIIDLTGIRDGTGPARSLDMVEGRAKQAFKTWLADRPQARRDSVQVVAMNGFAGFRTAATEELPDAIAVMTPSMSSVWPATPWTATGAASSSSPAATAATPATPSTPAGGPCTPASTCSPASRRLGSSRCSRPRSTCRSR